MGVSEYLKWRVRKKKGMLETSISQKIREQVQKELETEASLQEEKVLGLELPKEPDVWEKRGKEK